MFNIKTLFVAKFADKDPEKILKVNPQYGVGPFYHREIRELLEQLFRKVDVTSDINFVFNNAHNYDYIFSLLNHGKFRNSEIFISSIAEFSNVAYLGAPPNTRALAEDKQLAKVFARSLEIPTPEWKCYNKDCDIVQPSFGGPYFVKPRMAAGSIGITSHSFQSDWIGAKKLIKSLHKNNYDVIVEKFISGSNITFPIIADYDWDYFNCVEGISELKGNIMSHLQKRKVREGLIRKIHKSSTASVIKRFASKLYSEIQPIDYARFDFRVDDKTGIPYFIEFNVCCNLGSHSSIVQSAKSKGLNQQTIVKRIIEYSLNRQDRTL